MEGLTYTVAGVTVVRKYDAQSADPLLEGKAMACTARNQLTECSKATEQGYEPRKQLSALHFDPAAAAETPVVASRANVKRLSIVKVERG